MSTANDDNAGAVVAFVSGALIGVAATLLFVRMQNRRGAAAHLCNGKTSDNDYCYDGGDIFI